MSELPWAATSELCDRLQEAIADIAADTTEQIRSEFTDYAIVPLDEHLNAVREQLTRRLDAFRDHRAWGPNDIEQAVELARRRARQGVPVDILICAYHVGDRELWRRIVSDPVGAAASLPELTSLMLESMQAISRALVSAHSSEARAQESIRITVSQRLLDRLCSPLSPGTDTESVRLAEFLGFDPSADFLALALRPADPHAMSAELQGIVDSIGGIAAHAQFQSDCVTVVQASPVRDLHDALSALGPVGIGQPGPGIPGAVLSIRQARLALTSTTALRPTSSFRDRWLESCATSRADLVQFETARAVEVAKLHSTLAQTVAQFAESDMSIAHCARMSHLHVNTVTYRLNRWNDLTGWNPRLFRDLSKSVIACLLAEGITV